MSFDPFDLTPIFDKIQEDLGYVNINDDRIEKVLSDETHAVLTRLLNHYVFSKKPEALISTIKQIRDEISREANLYPIAKIYHPFQYIKNHFPEEFDDLKLMLRDMLEKVEDQNIVTYLKWLLDEPFITISVKVREIKKKSVEKGSIVKQELIVEDLYPVPNFSFSLVDPLDNFMWKIRTDDGGNAYFKVIPITYSKYDKKHYQIFISNKIIKFEPRINQQVELLIVSDSIRVNLIEENLDSSWFSNCLLCKKELVKHSCFKCENCGKEICVDCVNIVGILRKKKVCKNCKDEIKCEICGKNLSQEYEECEKCGKIVGPECMSVVGILRKKKVCKNCKNKR